MGYGEKVCDLGTFKVVDVRLHPTYGVVAYLDMRFEVVGSALEGYLSPIADRTEGIDAFVPNVGVDIKDDQLKPGEANAKVLFDGSVSGVGKAANCLRLFINAIEESLTNLGPEVLAVLNHDYHEDLVDSLVVSGLLAPGGRG